MGLDQYVYFRTKQEKYDLEHGLVPKDHIREEDMYFRKNRHLEDYMAKIWESRGNTEIFNCQTLDLTREDIEGITKDRMDDSAGGFFWGDYSLKENWGDIKKFKREALKALDEGMIVEYTSWW